MRIKREHRSPRESAIRSEIGHRQREGEASGRFWARGIGLLGPIGKPIWETVMLALFDVVEFLRSVRIRTVLRGEHLPSLVPTKTIRVAKTAGVDL